MIQRLVRPPSLAAFKWKSVLHDPISQHARLRSMSSFSSTAPKQDLTNTKIDDDTHIATLTLNRPPVNSLSLEMCTAISTAIKKIESNKKVQGLVLTSSNPSTLCAGLDLTELHNPDPERLPMFWKSFQQLFIDLYGSRLAVIGAIGGNAPAAGCMIAMACDYRIMVASPTGGRPPLIGLNEARFGIAAPPWLGQLMLRTVGFRQGEMALSLGTMFTPEQALGIGLVDHLVSEKEDIIEMSKKTALSWAKIPPHARVASKMLARMEFVDHLVKHRDADVEHFCAFVLNDKVQANLGAYLESLKRK